MIATDIDPDALAVARINRDRLGLDDRVDFVRGKSLSMIAETESVDLILSNPPYIVPGDPSLEQSVSDYEPHVALEKKLASFLGREAGMIFSSAYVTSLGVIVPLTTPETVMVSDELNHNCIIQAMRLSRPAGKFIYKHNDMADAEAQLKAAVGKGKRALVVTDGIFSMRGDHAPLDELVAICKKYEDQFPEGVITIVDDSHGIGAFGPTGKGTEEYTGAKVDVLIGTLGKAFGVNGGFVVSSATIIEYLRETAPM